MGYRPTTLKLASAHCPRAVDFYEQGAHAYREHFAVGIAAHDVLAKIGETTVALGRRMNPMEIAREAAAVARSLVESGRVFEGHREPPMAAEDAFAGSELAVSYALRPDTTWPTDSVRYEAGYAFDAAWRAVKYGSVDRRFRLILDRVQVITDEGEDYAGRIAIVTDYKSAWPTDESELGTYQMRAQAVAIYLTMGADLDGIRLQVANLRTGKTFALDLWFECGGREQIEQWRSEITAYMAALDGMMIANRRPARPGIGCLNCPYSRTCDAAIEGAEPEAMAKRLAKIEGERAALIKALKVATSDAPIELDDSLVGYVATTSRTPKDDASSAMRAAWEASQGDLGGLLTAIKPTMTILSTVAKRLYPESKESQAELVAEWSTDKLGKEFGVTRRMAQ